MSDDSIVTELQASRQRFLTLVADLRPELHRYCARMMGSAADGEDVVQETLARAYYALSDVEALPPLRPWLFHIAHHRAVDQLRRYERRHARPLDDEDAHIADEAPGPDERLEALDATRLALGRFGELAPAQRSVVILKDVLGHSIDEIARALALSEPAVKSALHRGRERLRALAASAPDEGAAPAPSPTVARYVELFNARDWDGVRALLADDVRLDVVTRAQRSGRRDVSVYFSRYEELVGWRLAAARIDGREAVAVYRAERDPRPSYLVSLVVEGGRVAAITDYRHVPYILDEAEVRVAETAL